MWLVVTVWTMLLACRGADNAPAATSPVYTGAEVVHTGGAEAGQPACTIVALHGLGDRPANFQRLYTDLPVKAHVVLLQAPKPWHQKGYAWFDRSGGDFDKLSPQIGAAADTLADGLASLPQRVAVEGKPIVTGFSQGGMLSFAVAVRHPELARAALPVGGMLPPGLFPTVQAPGGAAHVRAFHGELDQVIPIDRVRATAASLEARGFAVDLRTYPGVSHNIPPAIRRDYHQALAEACRR